MINDPYLEKRQETTKKKFKQTVANLVTLLRHAADVETVIMYWVNRARGQFVLEKYSTRSTNVLFEDRVEFDRHFLNKYKDIKKPVHLEIGRDIPAEELNHYHSEVPCKHLIFVPFVSAGETIALTVLESKFNSLNEEEQKCLRAYVEGLGNLLQTYLELADLTEDESHWAGYERQIEELFSKRRPWEAIEFTMFLLNQGLEKGGASFLVHEADGWHIMANDTYSVKRLPLGIQLTKNSLGFNALQSGAAEFAIHFNGNPKRVSPYEPLASGASYAIPLIMNDRRQGLFILHSENPLVFKESNKHKWRNLVRILGLKLSVNFSRTTDYFSDKFGLVSSEYWENILQMHINCTKTDTKVFSWTGFISILDVSTLRARYSADELSMIQMEFLKRISPAQYLVNGLLGFYSDYNYLFAVEGEDENSLEAWAEKMEFALRKPLVLPNGKQVVVNGDIVFTDLRGLEGSASDIIADLKRQLNDKNKGAKYSLAK